MTKLPRVSRIAGKLLRTAAIGMALLGAAIVLCLLWQNWLFNQQIEDARIINISGRQRMLSQRLLSKTLLLFAPDSSAKRDDILELLQQWESAHTTLVIHAKYSASTEPTEQQKLDSLFNSLEKPRKELIAFYNSSVVSPIRIETIFRTANTHSEEFLRTMEQITFQFEKVAEKHVANQKMATILSSIFLVLAVVIIIVVFVVPVVRTLDTEEQRFIKAILETEEKERARISQDLHDDVGHQMALLTLNVSSFLCREEDEEKRRHILHELQNISSAVRGISQAMSPTGLRTFGLVATLTEEIRRTNMLIPCTFNVHVQEERFSPDVELCIYRVTQELLTNILKHAQASSIDIQLVQHNNILTLIVEDNGNGFAFTHSQPNGLGLLGLHTRVMSLSGNVTIDSTIGRGTHVTVELPTTITYQS